MAKELPYFKFVVNEWITGDITLEDYHTQGVFISICAYYWSKDCDVTIETIRKRFKHEDESINYLLNSNIIKQENGYCIINFLNEQKDSKAVQKIVNRENGSKGGRPRKTETKPNGLFFDNRNETETKPKHNQYKGKERKGDNTMEKSKRFIPPTIEQVKDYFREKGYADAVAIRAFEYYDTANWHDASGKPVKNWKQKMIAVWFKPENEYKPSPAPLQPRHEDQLYDHVMAHVKKYGQ